ncbi:MAG: hypothetical protein ACM34K_01290 [Bacillota bacterium]
MKINISGMPVIEITEFQPNITYNNCSFGQPFPVTITKYLEQKPVDMEKLINYIQDKTGFNSEMIERVLEVADTYLSGEPNADS